MFDQVYNAAINSSSSDEFLKKIENLRIDAPKLTVKSSTITPTGVFLTPAAQLALEGEDEKVEWLRSYGANETFIAHGYALAGNHEKVKEYYNTYKIDPNQIAYAYIIAGNEDKAEEYKKMAQAEDLNLMAKAYALKRNTKKLIEYYTLGAEVSYIGYALALSGDISLDEYFVYRDGDQFISTVKCHDVYSITLGFALTNNSFLLGAFYLHFLNPSVEAFGFAFAGNNERVEELYAYGADIDMIIRGYRLADNISKVREYQGKKLLPRPILHQSFEKYEEISQDALKIISELEATRIKLTPAQQALENFFARHTALYAQAKAGRFGFFRNTHLKPDWGLKEILEHGMAHNNRTRKICVELGWLTKKGELSENAPEYIKNEIQSNSQKQRVKLS